MDFNNRLSIIISMVPPKRPISLYEDARENCINEEYEKALNQLNEALVIEPNYAEAMILLALVHSFLDFKKMSKDNALEFIEKALNLKSKSLAIWSDLIGFYSNLKDYEKAVECFNKTIEIDTYIKRPDLNIRWFFTNTDLRNYLVDNHSSAVHKALLVVFAYITVLKSKSEEKSSETAYRGFRSIQSRFLEFAKELSNVGFIQKALELDLSNFSKIIPELLEMLGETEEVELVKLKDIINGYYNELKSRDISSLIPWDIRAKIKETTINLGIKYPRLQIQEIAERCGSPQDCVIVVIREMIKNSEIYADYFESTQFVVFDQKANLNETENIQSKFELWEKTTCKNCGMKIKEISQKICEHCGLDL